MLQRKLREGHTWFPLLEIKPKINIHANISEHEWDTASEFFKGLQWKCGDDLQTSFLELAAHANHLSFSFDAGNTPAAVSSILKKFLSLIAKAGLASQTYPGVIVKKCKLNGTTFPTGLIFGGYAFVHPEALTIITVPFLRGRDHRLSQWNSLYIQLFRMVSCA